MGQLLEISAPHGPPWGEGRGTCLLGRAAGRGSGHGRAAGISAHARTVVGGRHRGRAARGGLTAACRRGTAGAQRVAAMGRPQDQYPHADGAFSHSGAGVADNIRAR